MKESFTYIIGIDEVGRGPLAGPVVVCACAVRCGVNLLTLFPKGELRDSKKLTEKHRASIVTSLSSYLARGEVYLGIGEVDAKTIDNIGISGAIKQAQSEALAALHVQGVDESSFLFLDGSLHADPRYQQETIIKGDEKIIEIALASIVAKEHRDAKMKTYKEQYPMYGFEKHVGYGTKMHCDAIRTYGATPIHRISFLTNILSGK